MPEAPARDRAGFVPVVLLGLASSALAAVASARDWHGPGDAASGPDAAVTVLDTGSRYPLASATSLVLLAAWGVLLVTRGRVRRAFAWLAALAAVGFVATVVAGYLTLPDAGGDSFSELMGRGGGETGFTAWFWTAAAAGAVALVPAGLAVGRVGRWPEMGTRYDAPGERRAGTSGAAAAGAADRGSAGVAPEQELWRALDEGRDPTDPGRS